MLLAESAGRWLERTGNDAPRRMTVIACGLPRAVTEPGQDEPSQGLDPSEGPEETTPSIGRPWKLSDQLRAQRS
jgi:hypothetical protein